MAAWTSSELDKIDKSDELRLQSERDDGSLRDPVTMWVVRHGDDLYVRAVRGRDGWYRGTRTRRQGHVSSGGVDKDVTFEAADTDAALNDTLDNVYRSKYGDYAKNIVDQVVNSQARSATLRLVPR